MARIYEDITQTIGHTPLVRLNRIAEGCHGRVLAKLEFFNPLSSIKDRVGVAMLDAAAAEGRLGPDTVVIEPTSGNTGIALAFAAAVRGVRLILTMPDSMSTERQALLAGLGAQLELTPAAEGMQGAVDRAHELAKTVDDALILQQFSNPYNPKAHYEGTGPEIWDDTEGEIHGLVAGVGTGGIHHRHRRLPQGPAPRSSGLRRRARHQRGALWQTSRITPDSGHRRRLRAREPGARPHRRGDHGDRR